MGCGASSEKNASRTEESLKQVPGNENHVQNDNESIKIKKPNNLVVESNNKSSVNNFLPSPQDSLEILVPKPNKPKTSVDQNSIERKSKELKQVQAWGKKTTKTETNFLEDLRIQRREKNPFYEQEYEISEVDETARFIGGREQDSGMIMDDYETVSEISSSDSSQQLLKIYKEGDQEESFDVSKIIDVEKFRAANVHKVNKKNEVGLNIQTKSTSTIETMNRSREDVKEGTFEKDLYNEDDKHLIESIEKEFLITQDNFLPGQIVN